MKIKTTIEIYNEWAENCIKNRYDGLHKKWVAVDDLEKTLFELAYKKRNGRVTRFDIDHRKIMFKLKGKK